ncbi:conserved domain-containing protein, partial [Geodermatophilus obscurus]
MINETQIQQVIGTTAIDADGDKIGKVSEVYLDDETGRPEWATVHTGLFGTKETFVPLAQAELSGEQLRFPYDKAKVKDAPKVDTDGHLSPQEEQELYRYYGLGSGTTTDTTTQTTTQATTGTAGLAGTAGMAAGTTGRTDRDRDGRADHTGEAGVVGRDVSGPTTDEAMTRSEERLNVGTRTEETGRARLRKYVVTENVTETVPVSREEVRVEREPITDANVGNALDGPAISEEEHEVTLHA